MAVSFDIKDTTKLDEVADRLRQLESMSVKIGVLSSSGGEVLLVANVQEFGATIPVTEKMRAFFVYEFGVGLRRDTKVIRIPERSYVRAGFDQNENKAIRTVENLAWQVIDGEISARDFYEVLGETIASDIREYLGKVTSPKLSGLTVRHKRSSSPLVDTGRLRGAITYEVE